MITSYQTPDILKLLFFKSCNIYQTPTCWYVQPSNTLQKTSTWTENSWKELYVTLFELVNTDISRWHFSY